MTCENQQADIYGAMNLLDEAVQRRGHEAANAAIEAWLAEEDQDRPDFRETLGQGVQDAITHAAIINEGKCTITIVSAGDALLRFEWFIEDGPSRTFERTVLRAVKNALEAHNG